MQTVQSENKTETLKAVNPDNEHACFAVVWVQGANENSESEILKDSEGIEGVFSARFSRKNPYILLASYDPDITNPSKIMNTIQRLGIRTRIVGC